MTPFFYSLRCEMRNRDLKAEDYPTSEDHLIVGKVQKAHGIRGELFIYLFAKEADWLDQLKSIKLIRHSENKEFNKFEYKLQQKRFHKEGLIVKSNEIDGRNHAEELKGAMFEIPKSFLETTSNDDFYLYEIEGFNIQSPEKETLGKILKFSSNGAQDLAEVKTENGTFSIPLVDEWIVELNREAKVIVMDLPEGLLDEV